MARIWRNACFMVCVRAWLALRPPGALYLAAAFRRRVARLGRGDFPASFGRPHDRSEPEATRDAWRVVSAGSGEPAIGEPEAERDAMRVVSLYAGW